jgi:flagellar biosynthesis/type III secretory pathway M-ring protein FliF/YscJ
MVDIIEDYVVYFIKKFIYNVTHAFTNMNSYRWIRLVTVVGAYFLIRPLFVKIGKKIQDKQLEKQRAADAAGVAEKAKAKISPNALRGLEDPADEEASEEEEEEEEEDKTTGAEWGKKERKKQRQMLKKIEEQEAKVMEDPSFGPGDKIILDERLVDYKEGEDGW